MARIDLHVHSEYSERPSEWFLQRLGAQESYTDAEWIYTTARQRGMDFATITDHNRIDGALLLREKHPEEVIVGVETTTYFPEDACKVHILLYGINEKQFHAVEELRGNIYDLRELIRSQNIACSVAHATYSINRKLTCEHLEKLILLFDVFEGINGARSFFFNSSWMEILQNLKPRHIEALIRKHGIEPISDDPWNKAFTGGSDDHAGLFIGTTYSVTEAKTPQDIIDCIREKRINARGRHNDYKSLALAIYKIAVDFAKNKNNGAQQSLLYSISDSILQPRTNEGGNDLIISAIKSFAKRSPNRIGDLIIDTIDAVKEIQPTQIADRFEIIFDKVSDIADEFTKTFVESLSQGISTGDVGRIFMNISSSLPGLFLSLPFLSSLKHMNTNKNIIDDIQASLSLDIPRNKKKILWFTDTINDLNGVSETLRELSWFSYRNGKSISLVTAMPEKKPAGMLPPNTVYVPTFHSYTLPMYENLTVHFPSVLKSIELISKEDPTEIYISTPGPVGLLGLLVARILKLKCTGIYHTDFAMQVERIANDSTLTALIEQSTKWFYSMMDVIRVPTQEYADLLKQRGFDESKLKFFRRRIDPEIFSYNRKARRTVLKGLAMKEGFNLLYAGRISRDKNLDMLCSIYIALTQKIRDINLIIAGDGPYLSELQDKMKDSGRVRFTGRLPRHELPEFYSASDIFVFPSTTDTFGMVVMEAQSCGLPALVTDIGGPQEIIINGETGFILEHDCPEEWIEKIRVLHELKTRKPTAYNTMRILARNQVICRFGSENYLEQVTGEMV